MELRDYFICFAVAFLGMTLQALLRVRALQDKARKANVEFKVGQYMKDDWVSHVTSIVTIFLFMFFIDEFANFNAKVLDYIKIGFAFIGYTGSDIASRLFSVVNRRINNAIDYKTTQADSANNTLDKPTPAK